MELIYGELQNSVIPENYDPSNPSVSANISNFTKKLPDSQLATRVKNDFKRNSFQIKYNCRYNIFMILKYSIH